MLWLFSRQEAVRQTIAAGEGGKKDEQVARRRRESLCTKGIITEKGWYFWLFIGKNSSEFALAIVLFCMKCINEGVAKGRKRRKIEKTIADKAGKAKWKNWKRKAGDPSF